jgi:hypothetical protein
MQTANVTIQFPTVKELWEFRTAISSDIFQMNLHSHTITCQCTEAQVGLAIEQYRGKVLMVNADAKSYPQS